MKLSALIFLLGLSNLLAGQTIGTIYHPSTITDLIDGACRTKRVMDTSEIVLHSQFKTIQFVSLRNLYNANDNLTPIFFPYYVFRKVGEGLVLEATGTTDGLLAVTVKEEGVYYGVLNGPGCVMVVRLEANLEPLVGKALLYECCVSMSGLN